MKRKYIEDETLINLIKDYVNEELYGDCAKLTYSGIGEYVRKNGYPKLNDKSIRDKKEVVNYVRNLKGVKSDRLNAAKKLVVFKSLDAKNLFCKNIPVNDMISILNQRDDYYKSISDNCSLLINEFNKLEKDNIELRKKIKELENFEEKYNEIAKINITLRKQNKQQLEIINNYINPEIANEILKEDGLLEKTNSMINESEMKEKIITPDKNIKEIKNNTIKHLFSLIEDK